MTRETMRLPGAQSLEKQAAIPIVGKEVDDLEHEIGRFRGGEWAPAKFTAFQLLQGVYGQRQHDYPSQWAAISLIAAKCGIARRA